MEYFGVQRDASSTLEPDAKLKLFEDLEHFYPISFVVGFYKRSQSHLSIIMLIMFIRV